MKRKVMPAVVLIMVFVMVLNLLPFGVFAEEAGVITQIQIDYDNKEINVVCQTAAKYIQRISVVICDATVTSPELNDFIRLDEAVTDSHGEAVVTFKMGDDIKSSDYTFIISGSGEDAFEIRVSKYILGLGEADDIIGNINASNGQEALTYISQIAVTVGINVNECEDYNKSEFFEIFDKVKQLDFADEFTSITQVKTAWDIAAVLMEIKYAKGADKIGELLEKNKQILELPALSADKTEAYRVFYSLLKGANNSFGIMSKKECISCFAEANAVACINKSSINEIESKLITYASALGIENHIKEYMDLGANDKLKVARYLKSKTFDKAIDVKNALINAIGQIDDVNGNTGGGRPNRGSGTSSSTNVPVGKTENKNQEIFSDADSIPWAKECINALYEMNIVNGFPDGTFKGDLLVTRGQFVKMLTVGFDLLSDTAKCDFSDIGQSHWCYEYIASAVENNIIMGKDDGKFAPEEPILRQDMAVMLWRIAQNRGIDCEAAAKEAFKDSAEISDYVAEGVNKLFAMGIISGFEDGSFMPKGLLTRAQAAKVIYEFLKFH